MKTNFLRLNTPGLVLAGLLTACSGGDVNIAGPVITPFPQPAASEPITTHGVITGFDDLRVNGIGYDTGQATVTVNGHAATVFDLERGQIVTVKGRINGNGWSGTAESVRYDANLIGPVDSLDAAGDRLMVMGQTVLTDPDTQFAAGINPTTFAGLAVGNVVQISGFTDADGALRATRVDPHPAGTELQIIGKVAGLDLANLLFKINRLTLDYGAAVLLDLPGGAPSNGLAVKAIGTMSGGLFVVDRLTDAPALEGAMDRRVHLAGMITRFSSQTDFDVNGSSVAANAGTAFVDGDASQLALNAGVVIHGRFDTGGRINADRIMFDRLLGETVTLSYALRDFTEIAVPTVFNITVTQGPDYSIEVVVDEDDRDRVSVTQTGSRLTIALGIGAGSIETLEALVTMPMLERIDLTGVVNARLRNFDQARMTVNVGGVSRLHGEALKIVDLTADVFGVSQLDFGDIRPIGNGDIDISGISQATLNMDVGATLTGSVGTGQGTGISTLFYYGTNCVVNVTTDPISTVIRLGGTRP